MSYRKIMIKFVYLMVVYTIYVIGTTIFTMKLNIEGYLWLFILPAVIYFPLSFVHRAMKKSIRVEEEKDKIIVENDLAHFKEVVKKALDENPIFQREVEMHLINVASVDLSIRYGISEVKLREKMGDAKFLSKYMGHAGVTLARMFDRRHDLKEPISKEQFVKEIREVMEAMR
ncbi:MAG: hypothetical protein GXO25_03840 [Euryarchaeota archaeon]|nr:hypothetical protein [Euryarchaeota archaeon]